MADRIGVRVDGVTELVRAARRSVIGRADRRARRVSGHQPSRQPSQRPMLAPPDELQPRPGLVDRRDLDVHEPERQRDLAHDVLRDVGRHLRGALRPCDPERPVGEDRRGERLDVSRERLARGREGDDDVRLAGSGVLRAPAGSGSNSAAAPRARRRARRSPPSPIPSLRGSGVPEYPALTRRARSSRRRRASSTGCGRPPTDARPGRRRPRSTRPRTSRPARGRSSRPRRGPRSITASTASGDETLWASVTPPQPPVSSTPLSSASAARSQSATIMPPAWKNTTPSARGVSRQPSAS